MAQEFEKLIIPIRSAAAPGTLAALSLAAFKLNADVPRILQLGLLLGAIMFLLSAFLIFFFSIYPTKKILWTGTAITFLFGLICLVSSAIALVFTI